MEKELLKYTKEHTQILNNLIEGLKKCILESLKIERDSGEITIKKCEVSAKHADELDFAVVLSAFRELTEPILILRVKYDFSEEDEFEIVDDDKPKQMARPLEDFYSAGFVKKGVELGLEDPDFYYINTKPWKSYETVFKSFKVSKKTDFFTLEYKIKEHDHFKMIYYHTEKFEDVFMRESKLFATRSIVHVRDLVSKTPGFEVEDLKSSMNMTQLINKNFKLVEKMSSKIIEKDKQTVKDTFGKKVKAQEVDANSANCTGTTTVKIEEKVFKILYEKMEGLSMVVYDPMASNLGNSVMPNRVITMDTKSEIVQYMPDALEELEGPEQTFEVSEVLDNEVFSHKLTESHIQKAYDEMLSEQVGLTPFDNNYMIQSATQNPLLQSETGFNGVLLFDTSLKPDLELTRDHDLLK